MQKNHPKNLSLANYKHYKRSGVTTHNLEKLVTWCAVVTAQVHLKWVEDFSHMFMWCLVPIDKPGERFLLFWKRNSSQLSAETVSVILDHKVIISISASIIFVINNPTLYKTKCFYPAFIWIKSQNSVAKWVEPVVIFVTQCNVFNSALTGWNFAYRCWIVHMQFCELRNVFIENSNFLKQNLIILWYFVFYNLS